MSEQFIDTFQSIVSPVASAFSKPELSEWQCQVINQDQQVSGIDG
jgi:hypothetical protein